MKNGKIFYIYLLNIILPLVPIAPIVDIVRTIGQPIKWYLVRRCFQSKLLVYNMSREVYPCFLIQLINYNTRYYSRKSTMHLSCSATLLRTKIKLRFFDVLRNQVIFVVILDVYFNRYLWCSMIILWFLSDQENHWWSSIFGLGNSASVSSVDTAVNDLSVQFAYQHVVLDDWCTSVA